MGCIKPQRLDVSADQQSVVVYGFENNDGRVAVVDAKAGSSLRFSLLNAMNADIRVDLHIARE